MCHGSGLPGRTNIAKRDQIPPVVRLAHIRFWSRQVMDNRAWLLALIAVVVWPLTSRRPADLLLAP